MGFGQGLSGLNAASQNLDVIGNNIANASTVGFKASTIAFADVYANSRVGLGVQVAAVNQRFTSGNLSVTGNQFDMAIDGEKGFFRLLDHSGATVYSRNGQFHADKDFNIVNAQGHRLTGYIAGPDGTMTTQLGPVKVPVGNIAPKATSESIVKANFDSRKPVISTDTSSSPKIEKAYGYIVLTDASGDESTYKYGIGDNGKIEWPDGAPADGPYESGDPQITITVTDGDTNPTVDQFPEGPDNELLPPAKNGVIFLTEEGKTEAEKFEYTVDALGEVVWDTPGPADGDYTSNGEVVTITTPPTPLSEDSLPKGGANTAYVPLGMKVVTTTVEFDPAKPENHTHSLPMTVYDSLGNPHQLTQYFVKVSATTATPPATSESQWEVYYVMGGGQLVDVDDTGENKATLTFDDAGRLTSTPSTVNIKIPGVAEGDSPAEDLVIDINYNGSTQFGGDFSSTFTQNGYATGEYASMSIASNGDIVANYTNGETKTIGAIVLADFNNVNGLRPIGGNAWIETAESGQPIEGQPGTNGMATLKGQSVEESNVDMSQELVNMIIAQRTYQANAQTIKTQDQILQTLITLR